MLPRVFPLSYLYESFQLLGLLLTASHVIPAQEKRPREQNSLSAGNLQVSPASQYLDAPSEQPAIHSWHSSSAKCCQHARNKVTAFTPRSIGSHGGSKEGSNKPPCACWAGSQRHTCCTWLSHAGTGDCLKSPDTGILRWGGRTEHSCTDVVRGVDVGKGQGF